PHSSYLLLIYIRRKKRQNVSCVAKTCVHFADKLAGELFLSNRREGSVSAAKRSQTRSSSFRAQNIRRLANADKPQDVLAVPEITHGIPAYSQFPLWPFFGVIGGVLVPSSFFGRRMLP